METTGMKSHIEVTEKSCFPLVQSLDVPPVHTQSHPARCLDTYEIFGGQRLLLAVS
jgi:hypothetical protein